MVPSILHLAGIPVPAGASFDGADFADALLGKATPVRKSPLIWVRPPDRPGPANAPLPDVAIRDGKWKLLQQSDNSQVQLYDLETDLGEKNNLADTQKETVERLQEVWKAFQKTLPPPTKRQSPPAK